MGVVYKAEDTRLNRTVALKFLSSHIVVSPDDKVRFVREAHTAAALDHPNICTVHEIDEVDGRTFIAMAFVEGSSLKEQTDSGPLAIDNAVSLAIDIAQGLQEAHEKDIVHRDIKSANIMVTKKGTAKITDFGLAKLAGATDVTKTGTTVGTAAYMSPEQARGENVDHRSDIWSLGVVLYEMLTGRLPFRGDHNHAVVYQIVHENPDPTTSVQTGVPLKLEQIVDKCLQKDASDRYQHADDILVDLRSVGTSRSVQPKTNLVKYVLPLSVVLVAAVLIAVLGPFSAQRNQAGSENPLAQAVFTKITNFGGAETGAALSPDGKIVAFVSNRDGPFDLWVLQVGTGDVHNRTRGQVGDARHSLRELGFSADGLEIWLGGTMERRLQLIPLLNGPPRTALKEKVINADWSSDGSMVVYTTPDPGDPVFVADGDGTNSREILASEPGQHQHYPTMSFDDQWIYLIRGREGIGELDLWRVRPDGRDLERLTEGHSDAAYPTPISKRTVLYVARNEVGLGPWLWTLDVETKVTRRANIGLARYSSVAASADGRRLVATMQNPQATLWSVPILDRKAVENDVSSYPLPADRALAPRFRGDDLFFLSSHGPGDGLWRLRDQKLVEIWKGTDTPLFEAAAISHDGSSVAIMLRRDSQLRLHLMSVTGGDLRSVGETIEFHGTAAWSPDGRWITAGGIEAGSPGLFKMSVDGGLAERIAHGEALDPVWSPNGDVIIYSGKQVGAFSTLLAVSPDGTPIEVPEINVAVGGARFRFLPDGNGLVYLGGTGAGLSRDFWLFDFTTQGRRRLTELSDPATINTFDISPDGGSIVFGRVRERSDIVLIELGADPQAAK